MQTTLNEKPPTSLVPPASHKANPGFHADPGLSLRHKPGSGLHPNSPSKNARSTNPDTPPPAASHPSGPHNKTPDTGSVPAGPLPEDPATPAPPVPPSSSDPRGGLLGCPPVLTVPQFARLMGYSRSTVYEMVRLGELGNAVSGNPNRAIRIHRDRALEILFPDRRP